MKKGILLILIAASFNAKAQSLKELLYGGKLRNDSSTVIRKTDDLSTKIDTATRKPAAETEKPKAVVQPEATAASGAPAAASPVTPPANQTPATVTTAATETAAAEGTGAVTETIPAAAPVAVKSNSRLWKEFTDSLVRAMKPDVQAARKVKKESYYLTVEYEVDTTGQLSILNLTSSPENDFLVQQVRDRLNSATPQLAPVVESGKARKVKRRHNFMITKD